LESLWLLYHAGKVFKLTVVPKNGKRHLNNFTLPLSRYFEPTRDLIMFFAKDLRGVSVDR